MRHVPDRENASGMGGFRHPCHVPALAGAVIHMAECRHRDALIERRHRLVLAVGEAQAKPPAGTLDHALQHMHVGGEIAVLGENDLTIGPERQAMADRLELVEGGRIAHHHLARPRPDHWRNHIAQQRRHFQPQPLAPAAAAQIHPVVEQPLGLGAHSPRHRPHRIGIHEDRAVRQLEKIADRRQRVLGIEAPGKGGADNRHGSN